MEQRKWMIIVNEECSIYGGNILVCESKDKAMNIASFVARILYNIGEINKHILVVNRIEVDATPTIVNKEDLEYRVIHHYSVAYNAALGLQMIILYDGWCNNHKKIASRWIIKGDK